MKERGDTLVEVAISVGILALVLIGCFTLASRAYRLGINARERTQAANLMQSQAEALRSWRDSHKWNTGTSSFYSAVCSASLTVDAENHKVFHFEQISGVWQLVAGAYNQPKLDASTPTPFYMGIWANSCTPTDPARLDFTVGGSWTPIGQNNVCSDVDGIVTASTGDATCNVVQLHSVLVNMDGLG